MILLSNSQRKSKVIICIKSASKSSFTVRWVGLQCVIVVFPDHTHLLFKSLNDGSVPDVCLWPARCSGFSLGPKVCDFIVIFSV